MLLAPRESMFSSFQSLTALELIFTQPTFAQVALGIGNSKLGQGKLFPSRKSIGLQHRHKRDVETCLQVIQLQRGAYQYFGLFSYKISISGAQGATHRLDTSERRATHIVLENVKYVCQVLLN